MPGTSPALQPQVPPGVHCLDRVVSNRLSGVRELADSDAAAPRTEVPEQQG